MPRYVICHARLGDPFIKREQQLHLQTYPQYSLANKPNQIYKPTSQYSKPLPRMSGLLGNVTNSLDNTLTGGDEEQGKGGLLGGVTNTVGKTVDSAGNVIGQTVDGAGNIVGQTTRGVADTAGKTTQGVGNVAGGATNTASGLVGGATGQGGEAAQGAAGQTRKE